MVQMDVELRTPPNQIDSKMFKTPTPKVLYNLRSKVIWTSRSDRRSRSCTPMSFSPASTTGRRTPGRPSPRVTPNSLKRLTIDLREYNESNMKTPTRSFTSSKTPPCRPSKKRTKTFLSKSCKSRKSIGRTFFASNESPGTQLSKFMRGCAISTKSPGMRKYSPPHRTPGRASAKRANRLLHSVKSKISK